MIHPHAGGYIEFADEIEAVVRIFHVRQQGFVWTPGIYITPAWIRASGWKRYPDRLDYVHFKDVNESVYRGGSGERIRFFEEGCAKGSMCPIRTGTLDYPKIQETLKRSVTADT